MRAIYFWVPEIFTRKMRTILIVLTFILYKDEGYFFSEQTLPVSEIAIELNDWKGFELWYQKRAWSDLQKWDICDISWEEGRWFTGILDISKRWHLNLSSEGPAAALFMRSKYDLNIPDICSSASFVLRLMTPIKSPLLSFSFISFKTFWDVKLYHSAGTSWLKKLPSYVFSITEDKSQFAACLKKCIQH